MTSLQCQCLYVNLYLVFLSFEVKIYGTKLSILENGAMARKIDEISNLT